MSDRPPEFEPGRWLMRHETPAGLVQRALIGQPAPRRSSRVWAVAIAAAFLVGAVSGSGAVWLALGGADSADAIATVSEGELLVPVRLVVRARDATEVAVAGSFNDWSPEASPMEHVGDGLFRTVVWLPRGEHEYMFVADGKTWIPDETAPVLRDDGFGNQNAVLQI